MSKKINVNWNLVIQALLTAITSLASAIKTTVTSKTLAIIFTLSEMGACTKAENWKKSVPIVTYTTPTPSASATKEDWMRTDSRPTLGPRHSETPYSTS